MNLMQKAPTEFVATITDGRGRDWYVTFYRVRRGMFPSVKKIERAQDNGKYDFVTLYRPSCHGDLPTIVQNGIKEMSQHVKAQP